MPDKAYEEARSLWEKYRVLTHELMKFIDEEEAIPSSISSTSAGR